MASGGGGGHGCCHNIVEDYSSSRSWGKARSREKREGSEYRCRGVDRWGNVLPGDQPRSEPGAGPGGGVAEEGGRRGGINRAYLRADWRRAQSSEISGKRMGGRRVPRSSSPAARGRDWLRSTHCLDRPDLRHCHRPSSSARPSPALLLLPTISCSGRPLATRTTTHRRPHAPTTPARTPRGRAPGPHRPAGAPSAPPTHTGALVTPRPTDLASSSNRNDTASHLPPDPATDTNALSHGRLPYPAPPSTDKPTRCASAGTPADCSPAHPQVRQFSVRKCRLVLIAPDAPSYLRF